MADKFDMNRHGVMENFDSRTKSKLVDMVFDPVSDTGKNYESRIPYEEVSVERITPRSVNRYSQTRIERLAQSIRNTNNRLIHPIVLVKASDLPKESEVLKKFEERGIDTSSLEYVIVSGERRFRAWMLLREEASKEQGAFLNPFDTITANVLSKKEAKSEEIFFEDSNLESRQLTPVEYMLHVKDAVRECETKEEKDRALCEMGKDPEKDRFNQAEYCKYYMESELGLEIGSIATIKRILSIFNNCNESVINAIIDGKITLNAARDLTKLPREVQARLVKTAEEKGEEEFLREKDAAVGRRSPKTTRVTYKDAQKSLLAAKKQIERKASELSEMAESLPTSDKKAVLAVVRSMQALLESINSAEEKLR